MASRIPRPHLKCWLALSFCILEGRAFSYVSKYRHNPTPCVDMWHQLPLID